MLSDGIKIKFSFSVLFFKITLYFLSILFCETPCTLLFRFCHILTFKLTTDPRKQDFLKMPLSKINFLSWLPLFDLKSLLHIIQLSLTLEILAIFRAKDYSRKNNHLPLSTPQIYENNYFDKNL